MSEKSESVKNILSKLDDSKKNQDIIENITSEHVKEIDSSLKNKEEDLKKI